VCAELVTVGSRRGTECRRGGDEADGEGEGDDAEHTSVVRQIAPCSQALPG